MFLKQIANMIEEICPEAIIVRAYSDHFLVLHTTQHEAVDYGRIDALLAEQGLVMCYQHLDLDMNEAVSLEILEDKLLNLTN